MNHQLSNNIMADMIIQVPGDLKDRRTPLAELHWIFTAITNTIAWTTFPRDVIRVAERIMKNYRCTPQDGEREEDVVGYRTRLRFVWGVSVGISFYLQARSKSERTAPIRLTWRHLEREKKR
jgi:hypothetical protein